MILLWSLLVSAVWARNLQTFGTCMYEHSVHVSYNTSADWPSARTSWNLEYTFVPDAVVWARTVFDVSEAVICAHESGHHVSPRSGGHSYATLGEGGRNGAVIIDLSQMDRMDLDEEHGVALVGPGVRLGKLAEYLWKAGRYFVPMSLCPWIGVGGFSTGGGVGHDTRKFGPFSDSVLEMQAVLADGSIVTVNQQSHPSLFWALRGAGGGQLAIVTNFRVALQQSVVGEKAFGAQWFWKPEDMGRVFCHIMNHGANLHIDTAWQLHLYKENITLEAFATGDVDARLQELNLMLKGLPDAFEEHSTQGDHYTAWKALADPITLPRFQYSLKSSVTMSQSVKLPPLICEGISYLMHNSPSDSRIIVEFIGGGGPVNTKSNRDSSFGHQHTDFIIAPLVKASDPARSEHLIWQREVAELLRPHTTGRAYINAIDLQLDDWARMYWGQNTRRLKRIQLAYDPHDVFEKPLTINRVAVKLAWNRSRRRDLRSDKVQ